MKDNDHNEFQKPSRDDFDRRVNDKMHELRSPSPHRERVSQMSPGNQQISEEDVQRLREEREQLRALRRKLENEKEQLEIEEKNVQRKRGQLDEALDQIQDQRTAKERKKMEMFFLRKKLDQELKDLDELKELLEKTKVNNKKQEGDNIQKKERIKNLEKN